MFGGMNPKKIQGMMKKMGISQIPIDAKRVIIETEDSNIIINEPQVVKVNMQGQETWQISGEATEESAEPEQAYTEDDVKMVSQQADVDEESAKQALEKSNGDIAEAIMFLKG